MLTLGRVSCVFPPLALGVAARGGIGREPKAWQGGVVQWWVFAIKSRANLQNTHVLKHKPFTKGFLYSA